MDGTAFDRLVRAFVGTSSRRRLLGLLTALPLATRLAIPADSPAARAGKTRRHRAPRQQRHSPTRRGDEQRREAHSEACIPTGQRCPSRKPRGKHVPKLSCKHCCQGSFTTNATGKRVCGCQPNGGSCSAETAPSCCSGSCNGATCHIPPSAPCGRTCAGCCDASGACQVGSSESACGTGGAACSDCAGARPSCVDNTCTACTNSRQCPVNTICDPSGACLGCDVCLSGACDFTSVQAAINATPQRPTIRVCAGAYMENAVASTAVSIARNLRLIGAGDGADPAVNTILGPDHPNQRVMQVEFAASTLTVSLERLRLTGATGDRGLGLSINRAIVTVDTCTITDNHNDAPGGGMIINRPECRVSLINTQITGNSSKFQGGGIQFGSGQLSLDERSRVTNNSTQSGGQSGGGILTGSGAIVDLASVANVTDNHPTNCSGDGTFTGPGNVCTMT